MPDKPVPDNPYERRGVARRTRGGDSFAMNIGSVSYGAPRVIAVEDLEALAASAHDRGARTEREGAEREHQEALNTARRLAWAEGHTAGVADGRTELLRAIDQQWQTKVRNMIEELEKARADPKVTRAALTEKHCHRAILLFEALIEAQHDGFDDVADIPF